VASGSFALKCFATARSESRLVARGSSEALSRARASMLHVALQLCLTHASTGGIGWERSTAQGI